VLPQTKLKDADRVEVRFSPHITWDNLQVGYYLLSLCIMRPCCSNLCCKYDFWCNKFKCIHRLLHFNHWRWFFWDSIRCACVVMIILALFIFAMFIRRWPDL
jgi:hypothetical protein